MTTDLQKKIEMNTKLINELDYKIKSFEDKSDRLLKSYEGLTDKFNLMLTEMSGVAVDFKSIQKDISFYILNKQEQDEKISQLGDRIKELENFKVKVIAYATIIGIVIQYIFKEIL